MLRIKKLNGTHKLGSHVEYLNTKYIYWYFIIGLDQTFQFFGIIILADLTTTVQLTNQNYKIPHDIQQKRRYLLLMIQR